jgi:hypothetical protein
MITEEQIEKHRFFTTDGTDMWMRTKVKTLTVVDLVNCETGEEGTLQLGEPSAIVFVPVIVPKVKTEGRGAGDEGRGARGEGPGTKGPGVRTGTKRGKYKTKTDTIHETGRGVRRTRGAGKKATSKYMGVTVRTNNKGGKRFVAQIARDGKYKALGSYKTEELAAAAVQDHLGKEEEAKKLRKLSEQKTDQQIRKLKEETEVTAFDCKACGAGYKYKPDVCGKCSGSSFTPARPEREDRSKK